MAGFLFQFALIAALPAIFVGGAAAFFWREIGRPWLFVILALVVLYAVYVAIFYLLPSQAMGYTVIETGLTVGGAKNYDVATHEGELNPSFMGQYVWQLLLFTVLAIPVLWFLLKFFVGKTP